MVSFFDRTYTELVDSPNGCKPWWHSLPLPDGRRVNGANSDKDLQLKMWDAMGISSQGGLNGKTVLDIGANDGFFTIAAFMAGAARVTAINTADWLTWPANIKFATRVWDVNPAIITDDFRTHLFSEEFDVILFLGVLYHLENVFDCTRRLRSLLRSGGVVYIETHVTDIEAKVPLFEYASDLFHTSAPQGKNTINLTGISNYLLPNVSAMQNLAYSYDLDFHNIVEPYNLYSRENPRRQFFKMAKL
jgi:2-polyprenyl-3-methyl-5-hydroxy-6-metoxy-1,4-benzoquinol methylase